MSCEDKKNPCKFCFNARVCPPSDDLFDTPFTDENDFSSIGIGDCEKGFCFYINSGCGKPVNIEAMKLDEKKQQWFTAGIYESKYCP